MGIRIGIGVGGLAYGLLGLTLAGLTIRGREANRATMALNVLLVALSILLLYRVATADSVAGLLAVTSWLVIGSGIAIALAGVVRRLWMPPTTAASAGNVTPNFSQSESEARAADPRANPTEQPAPSGVDERGRARRAIRRFALVSGAAAVVGAGVHPRIAQELLRHASSKMTMEIYSHVSGAQQREAVEVLQRALTESHAESHAKSNLSGAGWPRVEQMGEPERESGSGGPEPAVY